MSEREYAVRCIYHGRVQGVGFRATVASIAEHCPVRGYVRNLADGTVELQVAGMVADVEDFLNRIATRLRGNISRTNSFPCEPPAETEFRVRPS